MDLAWDERLDRFIREDMVIIQSPSVFSFSADAVLLADFAKVSVGSRQKIVDFCCGNGAVTLLLAAKTKSKITGIEIQERLAQMAQRSLTLNNLDEQVEIIHGDVNQALDWIEKDSIDVITCNPPYFASGPNDAVNPNEHYAIARHEIHFDIHQAIGMASQLLKTKGKFFLVHRPERLLEILDGLREADLIPKRIQLVHPKANKRANIVLVEAIKRGKQVGLEFLPPLILHQENGDYTEEMKDILFGESS